MPYNDRLHLGAPEDLKHRFPRFDETFLLFLRVTLSALPLPLPTISSTFILPIVRWHRLLILCIPSMRYLIGWRRWCDSIPSIHIIPRRRRHSPSAPVWRRTGHGIHRYGCVSRREERIASWWRHRAGHHRGWKRLSHPMMRLMTVRWGRVWGWMFVRFGRMCGLFGSFCRRR